MRFAILLVVALATSCTTTAAVQGTLVYNAPGGETEALALEYEETFSTSALALACTVTAVIYGGACWAYLAVPFDADEATAMLHAREEAQKLGKCIGVESLKVATAPAARSQVGERVVVVRRRGMVLSVADVLKLCDEPAPSTPAAPSPPPPVSPAPAS